MFLFLKILWFFSSNYLWLICVKIGIFWFSFAAFYEMIKNAILAFYCVWIRSWFVLILCYLMCAGCFIVCSYVEWFVSSFPDVFCLFWVFYDIYVLPMVCSWLDFFVNWFCGFYEVCVLWFCFICLGNILDVLFCYLCVRNCCFFILYLGCYDVWLSVYCSFFIMMFFWTIFACFVRNRIAPFVWFLFFYYLLLSFSHFICDFRELLFLFYSIFVVFYGNGFFV